MEISHLGKLSNAQPYSKVHPYLDYLNFGALFDFFLSSNCLNLCNLPLVTCSEAKQKACFLKNNKL